MNNTIYTQLIHLIALIGVIVMMAMQRIDMTTGWLAIGALVGIALPSPFVNKPTGS